MSKTYTTKQTMPKNLWKKQWDHTHTHTHDCMWPACLANFVADSACATLSSGQQLSSSSTGDYNYLTTLTNQLNNRTLPRNCWSSLEQLCEWALAAILSPNSLENWRISNVNLCIFYINLFIFECMCIGFQYNSIHFQYKSTFFNINLYISNINIFIFEYSCIHFPI